MISIPAPVRRARRSGYGPWVEFKSSHLRSLGVVVLVAWAVSGYVAGTIHAISGSSGYGFRTVIWLLNLAAFAAIAVVLRIRHWITPWAPWLLVGTVAVALVLSVLAPRSPAMALAYVAVARELFISEATVKTHINNLFAKAALRGRAQAVAYAFRHGFATPG
ncbi:MAG: two component transcriptional regulator, LuxR family [Actinomycetia bacterium]|nr:two component transcriptional regulator, LuxR family [Actinomycetes bacterium]